MNSAQTQKAYKGLPMEGLIASWYAKTTLKDLKRHKLMAKQLVEKIPANGKVLEIAPGPGYFSIELAKLGNFQITGLDISQSFVEIARRNAAEASLKIDFREGNASAMPFKENTFDFTFCQAAFKNFSEPVKAIAEMQRVLRPGGLSIISDLRRDAPAEEIEREIKGMGLGPINRFMVRWTFRNMLLKNAYSADEMRAMVAQTPFAQCEVNLDGVGFQVLLRK
ncbi:MAG: class I SAM-dependent methyltransferase [Chloroflexi bacterium]|nr:MAG: class I SAM-dependent methyltransferase [Chloroflexota bacterium]